MAELDLSSLADEKLPEGHKSGFVAVAGRPNVGKSTLMNAFMGQKIAIVTPRPQTTRTNQLGIVTHPTYQIVFVDTPGLLQPRHKLDEYMVGVAQDAVRDADVVLWLVDAAEMPGEGDRLIAENMKAVQENTPVIVAMNKVDSLEPEEVQPRAAAYRELLPDAPWIMFSALLGDGVEQLLEMILERLPEGPRYYPVDQTTDTFIRDLAAELIREQIFLLMREELPYGTYVRVEEFKERENGVTYISATIFVERENHKKMVIGAKGRQLRQIGAAARQEIQELIQGRVYLDLWVKVEPNWRQDELTLQRFGYAQ